MKRLRINPKLRILFLLISLIPVLLIPFISIRLAIAHAQFPQPQAIFTLGGGSSREEFAAQFAKNYPTLPIWISSGIYDYQAQTLFQSADISLDRLHLDRRATDTVTNFTTLVNTFQDHDIHHLYLITSDFHMPRARAIAFLVLGSYGIAYTPISVPSDQPNESWLKTARDIGRSLLWIVTGRTGRSMAEHLKS
ncbi:MAG TPA: YdcF family protein [Elainellaceae cyanobacterium]